MIKEVLAEDVKGFRQYFTGDLYVDAGMELYRKFTYVHSEFFWLCGCVGEDHAHAHSYHPNSGGKLVKHSALGSLFKRKVWKGIRRAQTKGIQNGSLAGEATVNGGILLVSEQHGVHYQHNEDVGMLPSIHELLDACRSLSQSLSLSKEKVVVPLPTIKNGDQKRMVCTDDVCVLPGNATATATSQ